MCLHHNWNTQSYLRQSKYPPDNWRKMIAQSRRSLANTCRQRRPSKMIAQLYQKIVQQNKNRMKSTLLCPQLFRAHNCCNSSDLRGSGKRPPHNSYIAPKRSSSVGKSQGYSFDRMNRMTGKTYQHHMKGKLRQMPATTKHTMQYAILNSVARTTDDWIMNGPSCVFNC